MGSRSEILSYLNGVGMLVLRPTMCEERVNRFDFDRLHRRKKDFEDLR